MVGFDFLEIDRSSACDDVAVITGKQHDVVVGNDLHGLGILLVLRLRNERQERVLDDISVFDMVCTWFTRRSATSHGTYERASLHW